MATSDDRKQHWNAVFSGRAPDVLTWYQADPVCSLTLIATALAERAGPVIDVGGGASRLAERLLDAGYGEVEVLDVSADALAAARAAMGDAAGAVAWTVADVTAWAPPPARYAVWHDRAVFHFLTEEADRAAYADALDRALIADGQAVIATFAAWGPEKCSGLPTARYDADGLLAALGGRFRLLEQVDEDHTTPKGNTQAFSYFRLGRP